MIKDTKLIGITHNVMFGKNSGTTMTRRVRQQTGGVRDQSVDSCEALIWYLDTFGVIDSIDQSSTQYPIDFRCTGHWYRRLLYWGIDITMHNVWVIIQWHMGRFDPKGKDHIAAQNICYCQDSTIKKRKRHSNGGAHQCFFDREGMSARLKFHKDMSRALIERADRELKGAMRPGKRGRKRAADAPAETPDERPSTTPQSTITPGSGHHSFKDTMSRGRCVVCTHLVSKGKQDKVKQCTTGCTNCHTRAGSEGTRVCAEHFMSPVGVAMHKLRFQRAQYPLLNLDNLLASD